MDIDSPIELKRYSKERNLKHYKMYLIPGNEKQLRQQDKYMLRLMYFAVKLSKKVPCEADP